MLDNTSFHGVGDSIETEEIEDGAVELDKLNVDAKAWSLFWGLISQF